MTPTQQDSPATSVFVIPEEFRQVFEQYLPDVIGGLLILSVGLLAALIVAAVINVMLRHLDLDRRLGRWAYGQDSGRKVGAERWISRIAFGIVLLVVLVGFFEAVGLTLVTTPLREILQELGAYAPRILGAAVLLVVAWILARMVRFVVARVMRTGGLDAWLDDLFSSDHRKASAVDNLAATAYWLVFLLFVPALLEVLGLEKLQDPIQAMFSQVLIYLPKLVGAGLVLLIGWFVARTLQRFVSNFMRMSGLEKLGEQAGVSAFLGKQNLSDLVGLVVYIIVLIPVLIHSLETLQLEAITGPAMTLLNRVFQALGTVFAAFLLVFVSFLVARVVGRLAANLASNMGLNTLLARLGLGKAPGKGDWTLSDVVRTLVVAGLTLMASIEALRLLGFDAMAELTAKFFGFAGQVIIGGIIMVVGFFLANLASKTILANRSRNAPTLAMIAKIATIVLASAMALRNLGLASDIINLTFGLAFGGVAVGAAIAFGLGGREIAARKLEEWLKPTRSRRRR